MKKRIYVILVFFSLGLMQMNAQVVQGTSGSSSDMRFGAKAGLNISSLGGDTNLSYDSKPGFHLGAVLEIPFSDKISIQPEALVSLQGSGGFFEDDLNFWYLTIPVVAKYNVWDDLYIEAGPQLGVLFSDNLDGNSFGGSTSFFESNTIDFGLTAGAGYRLDENFYFQLRFNAGFLNAIDGVTSKNRVVQVSAVYFL